MIVVNCSCGKRLQAPPTAAGKTVACPHCKQKLKVPQQSTSAPAPQPQRPAQPAPQPQQTPAGGATAGQFKMNCQCGQQLSFTQAHVGKTVACPTCKNTFVVASPNQPVPVQVVEVEVIEPDIFDLNAQPQTPQAGFDPLGGVQQPAPQWSQQQAPHPQQHTQQLPYAGNQGQRGGGSFDALKTGLLITAIALCVFASSIAFSMVGRGLSSMSYTRSFSGPTTSENFRNRIQFSNTTRTAGRNITNIAQVLALLTTVALIVGYAMCMMKPGTTRSMMIGAIALAGGVILLDLLLRMLPGMFTVSSFDAARVRSFMFRIMRLIMELCVVGHLVLASLFVMTHAKQTRTGSPGVAVGGMVLVGIYGLTVFILFAIGLSTSLRMSTGLSYLFTGMFWIGNLCFLGGVGALIFNFFSVRKVRTAR